MKDLTAEIEKAVPLSITFCKAIIIDYAINKRGYDFEWDYLEGIRTLHVLKDDEVVGIILTTYPLGFILEKVYDDFKDLYQYNLVKVKNFNVDEWSIDVKKMQEIAPDIVWNVTEDEMDYSKLSILDFEFAVE